MLATALPVDHIIAPLTAKERVAAIDELLAGLLPDDAMPVDAMPVDAMPVDGLLGRVRDAVLAREDELTTGIGGGVAIPHARVEGVPAPLLALGIAPGGIDFTAIDGAPVHLVFLLVSGAEQTGPHVALLAELCALLNDTDRRARLAACATAAAARAVLT